MTNLEYNEEWLDKIINEVCLTYRPMEEKEQTILKCIIHTILSVCRYTIKDYTIIKDDKGLHIDIYYKGLKIYFTHITINNLLNKIAIHQISLLDYIFMKIRFFIERQLSS